MKIITSIIFALLVISSSPGHCSYQSDYQNSELTAASDNSLKSAKCFMLVDMIDNTKNKEEKKRLKTILKVELMLLQDNILLHIEGTEEGIIDMENQKANGSHLSISEIEKYISAYKEQLNIMKKGYNQAEQLLQKTK
jgi:hypothetical protein